MCADRHTRTSNDMLLSKSGLSCDSLYCCLFYFRNCISDSKCVTEMLRLSLCLFQKSVQDREFEALQSKVNRLEKLRRALKVERNELNKKVQKFGGLKNGTGSSSISDPGTDSPSPQPTDSPLEPMSNLVPEIPPCSQSSHCDPEQDSKISFVGGRLSP